MHPRQACNHSPLLDKPQSYFSRILLPDERWRTAQTFSHLKRPSVDESISASSCNSRRQMFHSHAGQTIVCRMPTLFDFQPDPGYSSAAFRRRLRLRCNSRLQKSGIPQIPTEPITQSKETFEQALRLLDSKKRTPSHLETDFSPPSDLRNHEHAAEQESKRRRILVDVASVGSTKENDSFRFTSLNQLRLKPVECEPVVAIDTADKNTVCPSSPSISRVLDAESFSFQTTNRTPVREIQSPLDRTPRSGSAIRRLIPYLSPAELDALCFGRNDRDNKECVYDSSDDEEEFGLISNAKGPQTSIVAALNVKAEEASTPTNAGSSSQTTTLSEASPSVSEDAKRDSHSIPRVGSVARFIANLEARGRKPSPLIRSSLVNRSGSAPMQFQCGWYRSLSEVSSRVDRIRQLLSLKTDRAPDTLTLPSTTSFSVTFPSNFHANSTATVPTSIASSGTQSVTVTSSALAFVTSKTDTLMGTTAGTASTALDRTPLPPGSSTTASNSSFTVNSSLGPFATTTMTSTKGIKTTDMVIASPNFGFPTSLASSGTQSVTVTSSALAFVTSKTDTLMGTTAGTASTALGRTPLPPGSSTTASNSSFTVNSSFGPSANTTTTSTKSIKTTDMVIDSLNFGFPTPNSFNNLTTSAPPSTLISSSSVVGTTSFSFPIASASVSCPTTSGISVSTPIPPSTTSTMTTKTTTALISFSPAAQSACAANTPAQNSLCFSAPLTSSFSSTTSTSALSQPVSASPNLFGVKAPPLLNQGNFMPASLVTTTSTTVAFLNQNNAGQIATASATGPFTVISTGAVSTTFPLSKPTGSFTGANVTSSPMFSKFGPSASTTASSIITTATTTSFSFTSGISTPLFSFTSKPLTTTVTVSNTAPVSSTLGSTLMPPVFAFGATSRPEAGLTTMTTTVSSDKSLPTTSSAFSGFTFGSTAVSKPVQQINIFSNVKPSSTTMSTTSSNPFTLGVKSTSFVNIVGGSTTQPSSSSSVFGLSQPTTASLFGGSTKAPTTTSTTNLAPFLFGASTSSAQLTSSATAPGQLSLFGSNPTSASISFTTASTTSSLFTFGQKVSSTTTGLSMATPFNTTSTTSSLFTFGQKASSTTTSALSKPTFPTFGSFSTASVTSTTSATGLFQFGASPATSTATGFNFTSPSLGSSNTTASIPSFGNTTGFNFGQATGFGNSGSTNPFAFGTTSPTAPGTAGAVALPRRRPASARRTRRV